MLPSADLIIHGALAQLPAELLAAVIVAAATALGRRRRRRNAERKHDNESTQE